MTKKEFKNEVEKGGKYNIYSINRITNRYNRELVKGWQIVYSVQLDDNTQTTEKTVELWKENLQDLAWCFPHDNN